MGECVYLSLVRWHMWSMSPGAGSCCILQEIQTVLYLQGTADDSKNKDKKKKPSAKVIELPLEAKTHGYTPTELQNYQEQEVSVFYYYYLMRSTKYWMSCFNG